MTDIINFNIKQLIESSVSELNKNLTNDIEKKIREDVINKYLEYKTKDSIFGFDDIKEFGKLKINSLPNCATCDNMYLGHFTDNTPIRNPPLIFIKDEYPIICIHYTNQSQGCSTERYFNYITNLIENQIMNYDEIFISILFYYKFNNSNYKVTLYSEFDELLDICIKNFPSLKLKKYIKGLNIGQEIRCIKSIDKLIKKYFVTVADYKIKAIEYDKIKDKQFNEKQFIKENKELEEEIYNIQTENIRLKGQNNKLDEENNIQKIIIKNFESRVQNNENQLLLKENQLQEYKHKYEQLIKDLEIQKQTFENDLLKKELQLVLLSNK